MKRNDVCPAIFFYFFAMLIFIYQPAAAQQYDCNFKAPVINIDFGNSSNQKDINLLPIENYRKVTDDGCPADGNFSFVPYTTNCFGGNWHTLREDHTPNDIGGRMMVVNAAETPGIFFIHYITGLKPGTTYEFSVWLVNICLYGPCGTVYSPDINIAVSSGENNIALFATGIILPTQQPVWKKYTGIFTIPAGANVIAIKMDDNANGGCGNDFAIDDLQIKECRMMPPPVTVAKHLLPVVAVLPKQFKKPVTLLVAKEMPLALLQSKKSKPSITDIPLTIKPAAPAVVKIDKLPVISIPLPLSTRANLLIKKIETEETNLLIEVYDNGEIDGDTVTIYHNNQLLVAHAGLSAKPITLKIKVDKEHPHHELIMVADNLGSIPPNTSLMVLTANKKRYEIFISSSEQKNAKIIIDLKEL